MGNEAGSLDGHAGRGHRRHAASASGRPRLVARGARVAVTGRKQDALDAAVAELTAAGGEVLGLPATSPTATACSRSWRGPSSASAASTASSTTPRRSGR